MENTAPGLLNLFSERLLVTGALDLLNEALTQALIFVEECLASKPISPSGPLEKVNFLSIY